MSALWTNPQSAPPEVDPQQATVARVIRETLDQMGKAHERMEARERQERRERAEAQTSATG